MSIITISHEAFGDGRAVAERVAAILGYRCISREVLIEASQRYGIAEAKFFEILEEKPPHRTQEERGFYPDRKRSATSGWGMNWSRGDGLPDLTKARAPHVYGP
jgi:Cytidylate kinase-like family